MDIDIAFNSWVETLAKKRPLLSFLLIPFIAVAALLIGFRWLPKHLFLWLVLPGVIAILLAVAYHSIAPVEEFDYGDEVAIEESF